MTYLGLETQFSEVQDLGLTYGLIDRDSSFIDLELELECGLYSQDSKLF